MSSRPRLPFIHSWAAAKFAQGIITAAGLSSSYPEISDGILSGSTGSRTSTDDLARSPIFGAPRHVPLPVPPSLA